MKWERKKLRAGEKARKNFGKDIKPTVYGLKRIN
jgi:hypothetical protein